MISSQMLIQVNESTRLKRAAHHWINKGAIFFLIVSESQMTIITWGKNKYEYEAISCCTYIPHINMVKHSRWTPSLESLFRKKNLDGKIIYFCDENGLKMTLERLGVLADWLIYKLTPIPKKEK